MYQLIILHSLMELGGDFTNTEPIVLTFAPKEVSKTANVPVKCDKRSETDENFDITLAVISNSPQVKVGRNKSVGIIRDIIGTWLNNSEYRWCNKINCMIVVNFDQLSYEVMEGRGEVMVEIVLSHPSPKQFKVMISLMDDTAKSEW